MKPVDPEALKYALQAIKDGFTFESFSQQFLSQLLGSNFIPTGGIKDKGIDGLEHIYNRSGFELDIYQMSIEKHCPGKLEHTLETLQNNNIDYERLTFVTNQTFPDKHAYIDTFFDKFNKNIRIWDIEWFGTNVNSSEGTIRAFQMFADRHLHKYQKPGQSYVVTNFESDSRLYVFLQQQLETNRQNLELDEILVDTLILFSLEGTDPDREIFMTKEEIKRQICLYVKFEPRNLFTLLDRRLKVLCQKPRKIKYHSNVKAYVLPYETRLEIQERNLKDAALHESFQQSSELILEKYLRAADVKVKDVLALLEATFNKIYSQQGLEFANFVLKGENPSVIEKELYSVVVEVVDNSKVIQKNRPAVKTALQLAIREIVYNGTKDQKEFLKRLSNTYMMLFMLQCEPQIATYFHSMASKLKVYVCNSIIVPAMSEYYLEDINRRHWNLLVQANKAGVNLIVNDTIVDELISHLRITYQQYKDGYEGLDDLYSEESQVLYIEPILIRAYFYEKMKRPTLTFKQHLDNFVPPNFTRAKENIITWLEATFGIKYRPDKLLGINIDPQEKRLIEAELTERKKDPTKAKNDASLILTIYALREKNNEIGIGGIFGYKTWWLSKDIKTHAVVSKVCGTKYKTSCYIRPDFLYTTISLSPTPQEASDAFDSLFPTLVGINLSFNLPNGVIGTVQRFISEHRDILKNNQPRLKAKLQDLTTRLKSDPENWVPYKVEHYLDNLLKEFSIDKK